MRISDWSSDVCSSDLIALAIGRRADRAAGDLDILPLERGDDFARGQIAGRRLVGIDPHAHRIEAAAADLDPADALEPEPALAQVRIGVIEIGRASWRERVCQYV